MISKSLCCLELNARLHENRCTGTLPVRDALNWPADLQQGIDNQVSPLRLIDFDLSLDVKGCHPALHHQM